jgi:simple sugar transport system substrate-binding protein
MSLKKISWLMLIVLLVGLLAACSSATPEVIEKEVTRVVTETEIQEVEVTRVVEGETVTEIKEVPVEVTRIVEVPAEAAESQVEAEPVAQSPKYRFVMVSHIGSNDPNMQWLTKSLATFEEKYPDVETEYLGTNEYSIQQLVQLLEQALATNPDGLAIPIASNEALEPILREAIDSGIPVVAFNIPDTRPVGERIPYLTYVGGDEYLTGLRLGQDAIAKAQAGEIPMPTGVVCMSHDAAHQGLKQRCAGMTDAMAEIGVETEELFTGANPEEARSTLESYLSSNADVNYVFALASWSSPWAYSVAADLGLSPDVDNEGMTIVTVDASPAALEGIKAGKVLSTHSQGFWLQGFLTMEWLYWNKTLNYVPQSDMLTGPVVIDKTHVDDWIELVRNAFGPEEYDKQAEVWN